MTHIRVGKITIIGSNNRLSPGRHLVIIWINVGISLIGPLRTKFSEILIFVQENVFKNVTCELASILFPSQCVKFRILLINICIRIILPFLLHFQLLIDINGKSSYAKQSLHGVIGAWGLFKSLINSIMVLCVGCDKSDSISILVYDISTAAMFQNR